MKWIEFTDKVYEDIQRTENEFLYPHNRDVADAEIVEGLEINKALDIMKEIAKGDLVIMGVEKSRFGRKIPMEMTWEKFDRWVRQRVQWAENNTLQPYNENREEFDRVELIEKISMYGLIRQLVDGRIVIVDL